MNIYLDRKRESLSFRVLCAFMAFSFVFSIILPPGYAQTVSVLNLPTPGTMVPLSPGFTPPLVKGITINPQNPLQFDFYLSKGDVDLEGEALKEESRKLIKYFLASLTVPEEELWVNLSPYENDRMISEGFGQTEMGRDMLAQDYILKQLTASLTNPEDELGQKFWDRVYQKAYEKYGTTKIPMNTFNKVWIVPDKAVVYEHENSAFVVESHLKVMLEEDYVAMDFQQKSTATPRAPARGQALQRNFGNEKYGMNRINDGDSEVVSGVSSEIMREVLIPELEKEVNQGETFAQLRQIFDSSILAVWYKQKLEVGTGRDLSLLGQVYIDKNKTKGINVEDKNINQKIYNQYLEAFKKGVYNYIREDFDPATQEVIPRKYFSGGTHLKIEPILINLPQKDFEKFDDHTQALILDAVYDNKIKITWMALEAGTQDPKRIAQELESSIEPPAKAEAELALAASPVKIAKVMARDIKSFQDHEQNVVFYTARDVFNALLPERKNGTLRSVDLFRVTGPDGEGHSLRIGLLSSAKKISPDQIDTMVSSNDPGYEVFAEEAFGEILKKGFDSKVLGGLLDTLFFDRVRIITETSISSPAGPSPDASSPVTAPLEGLIRDARDKILNMGSVRSASLMSTFDQQAEALVKLSKEIKDGEGLGLQVVLEFLEKFRNPSEISSNDLVKIVSEFVLDFTKKEKFFKGKDSEVVAALILMGNRVLFEIKDAGIGEGKEKLNEVIDAFREYFSLQYFSKLIGEPQLFSLNNDASFAWSFLLLEIDAYYKRTSQERPEEIASRKEILDKMLHETKPAIKFKEPPVSEFISALKTSDLLKYFVMQVLSDNANISEKLAALNEVSRVNASLEADIISLGSKKTVNRTRGLFGRLKKFDVTAFLKSEKPQEGDIIVFARKKAGEKETYGALIVGEKTPVLENVTYAVRIPKVASSAVSPVKEEPKIYPDLLNTPVDKPVRLSPYTSGSPEIVFSREPTLSDASSHFKFAVRGPEGTDLQAIDFYLRARLETAAVDLLYPRNIVHLLPEETTDLIKTISLSHDVQGKKAGLMLPQNLINRLFPNPENRSIEIAGFTIEFIPDLTSSPLTDISSWKTDEPEWSKINALISEIEDKIILHARGMANYTKIDDFKKNLPAAVDSKGTTIKKYDVMVGKAVRLLFIRQMIHDINMLSSYLLPPTQSWLKATDDAVKTVINSIQDKISNHERYVKLPVHPIQEKLNPWDTILLDEEAAKVYGERMFFGWLPRGAEEYNPRKFAAASSAVTRFSDMRPLKDMADHAAFYDMVNDLPYSELVLDEGGGRESESLDAIETLATKLDVQMKNPTHAKDLGIFLKFNERKIALLTPEGPLNDAYADFPLSISNDGKTGSIEFDDGRILRFTKINGGKFAVSLTASSAVTVKLSGEKIDIQEALREARRMLDVLKGKYTDGQKVFIAQLKNDEYLPFAIVFVNPGTTNRAPRLFFKEFNKKRKGIEKLAEVYLEDDDATILGSAFPKGFKILGIRYKTLSGRSPQFVRLYTAQSHSNQIRRLNYAYIKFLEEWIADITKEFPEESLISQMISKTGELMEGMEIKTWNEDRFQEALHSSLSHLLSEASAKQKDYGDFIIQWDPNRYTYVILPPNQEIAKTIQELTVFANGFSTSTTKAEFGADNFVIVQNLVNDLEKHLKTDRGEQDYFVKRDLMIALLDGLSGIIEPVQERSVSAGEISQRRALVGRMWGLIDSVTKKYEATRDDMENWYKENKKVADKRIILGIEERLGISSSAVGTEGKTAQPGGIDLNPSLFDLQIKRDANGVPLPLPQQPIEQMNIEGFFPVIINIVPVTNLPMILGINLPEEKKTEDLSLRGDSRPMDRKARFEIEDLERELIPIS